MLAGFPLFLCRIPACLLLSQVGLPCSSHSAGFWCSFADWFGGWLPVLLVLKLVGLACSVQPSWMVISLVAGPCCLVLSVDFLLVVAGCAVLCNHIAGFAMFLVQFCWLALFFMAGFCSGCCLFWCSSASCFYSWWLGFGFKTLVWLGCQHLVDGFGLALLPALCWCIASVLPPLLGCFWLLLPALWLCLLRWLMLLLHSCSVSVSSSST